MPITRLHIVLGLITAAGAAGGGYYWWMNHPEAARLFLRPKPTAQVQRPIVPAPRTVPSSPSTSLPADAAKLVAIVGEAYLPLHKTYGEIPAVAVPLRAAKNHMAGGEYPQAMAQARTAWEALKSARGRGTLPPDTYVVVKGDTLWRIAAEHSPVRQGPGWVTIWKANKKLIKNFDRLETGWELTIPVQPRQYVTAYWKPKMTPSQPASAAAPRPAPDEVDVAELPVEETVDLAELPVRPEAHEEFIASALKPPTPSFLSSRYH